MISDVFADHPAVISEPFPDHPAAFFFRRVRHPLHYLFKWNSPNLRNVGVGGLRNKRESGWPGGGGGPVAFANMAAGGGVEI